MSRLVGKIIGGVVGGAFAIGGAVSLSQLDAQTDEINKQVDTTNAITEKVSDEYLCVQTQKCQITNGTPEEYEALTVKYNDLLDKYNSAADQYNTECTEREIKESEEQKCIDLNNNTAKIMEEITIQLEQLDTFVEDI